MPIKESNMSRRDLIYNFGAFLMASTLVNCSAEKKGANWLSNSVDIDTAKEAWIYAYPMLMNYQTMYKQAIDPTSKEYVGGFGVFRNYSDFFTPANRDIVTPNNDTPYSWSCLDLRSEPWILSVPAIPRNRYNSFQCIDLFTYNFAYVGVRATGYQAGNYLFAGPLWNGSVPIGINKVFKAETEIIGILGRTSLDGKADIPALKALQAKYKLTPLSKFSGTPPPTPAAPINFPKWDPKSGLGIDFISYLNFLLQFCQPINPSETGLMERFAKIGIGPGRPFDATKLDRVSREALEAGIHAGEKAIQEKIAASKSSLGWFGTRAEMKNDYLTRAAAAAAGIYGNSKEEAVYEGLEKDADGQSLNGNMKYVWEFPKGGLPPTTLFWSITIYSLPDRELVENSINRYSIGRNKDLKYNPDGSLTIYLQRESPGKNKESNWLPTPVSGPFVAILRMYGPKPDVLNGKWQSPAIRRLV